MLVSVHADGTSRNRKLWYHLPVTVYYEKEALGIQKGYLKKENLLMRNETLSVRYDCPLWNG